MVERWGVYELTLTGPETGNPFVDVELTAEFAQNGRVFAPHGFYDGDGRCCMNHIWGIMVECCFLFS